MVGNKGVYWGYVAIMEKNHFVGFRVTYRDCRVFVRDVKTLYPFIHEAHERSLLESLQIIVT